MIGEQVIPLQHNKILTLVYHDIYSFYIEYGKMF